MTKICLVEDEKDLNNILTLYLKSSGYEVTSCKDKSCAVSHIDERFDLWILDIVLPDGNGIEILKKIKVKNSKIPVILISARGDRFDRVLGFEVGCDDYIAKPFLPAELVYRVAKILNIPPKDSDSQQSIIEVGNYTIDKKKRTIMSNNRKIDLTSREFDFVIYFVENKSIAISRELLLEKIWGSEYFGSDRVVDNYVKNIRKKLPLLNIETIYGYGYRCNL